MIHYNIFYSSACSLTQPIIIIVLLTMHILPLRFDKRSIEERNIAVPVILWSSCVSPFREGKDKQTRRIIGLEMKEYACGDRQFIRRLSYSL